MERGLLFTCSGSRFESFSDEVVDAVVGGGRFRAAACGTHTHTVPNEGLVDLHSFTVKEQNFNFFIFSTRSLSVNVSQPCAGPLYD